MCIRDREEGEVLSRQSINNLQNNNGVVASYYKSKTAFRLIQWIIHAHRIIGVEVPSELYTLLQMREDDSQYMPDRRSY